MQAEDRQNLVRWAEALGRSETEELRAAGRAITTLCAANPEGTQADRRELERWAKSLGRADVAELRAAGRAIRILCSEQEQRERAGVVAPAANSAGEAAAARPEPSPTGETQRRPRLSSPRLSISRRRAVVVLGVLLVVSAVLALAARAATPDLTAEGPELDAVVGPKALAGLSFSSTSDGVEWRLDGKPIEPARRGGETVFRPARLAEGAHELVIRKQGPLFASAERSFRFVIDTTAPKLTLDGPAVVSRAKPLRLRGRLEPGARLVSGAAAVAVASDGTFDLRVSSPPASLLLTATDTADNVSRWRVPVTMVPRRPTGLIRAVHVTAYGWADDTLRKGVMDLVRAKKINAVELDLKDESGEVGWPSRVPLAKRIGSQLEIYDLKQVTKDLHRLGVRVIGRLVVFRDPIHAQASWKAGRRSEVVQTQDGEPYSGYGGFTNLANPAVRKYNIDLAVAAAAQGVDEILYDYVRRPDGPLSSMVFPGLDETPEQAIVRFLAESRAALAKTDTLIGASVFGVAATRPEEVAQDIPAMARHLDYVAPMLYPSHWGPGEYDVADPNGQPYEITLASSKDFVRQVRGSGARIVNWLQDFSYGRTYGPAEVRAQIKASRDAGVDEFILWDAAVTYTADALEPTAQLPAVGNSSEPPRDAPMPVRLPSVAPARLARPGPRAAVADARPRTSMPANELGQIPVVMHHMIRADRVGDYDQTPQEFRAELEYLWRHGYTPITVGELLSGKLDVPRGTTPVVLTFDDATTYQFELDSNGSVKPKTAVGIMLEFARNASRLPAGRHVLRQSNAIRKRRQGKEVSSLVDAERFRDRQPHARPHPPQDALGGGRPEASRDRCRCDRAASSRLQDPLPGAAARLDAEGRGAGRSRKLAGAALRPVRRPARRRESRPVALLTSLRPGRHPANPNLARRLEGRGGLRLQLLDAGVRGQSEVTLRLGRRSRDSRGSFRC